MTRRARPRRTDAELLQAVRVAVARLGQRMTSGQYNDLRRAVPDLNLPDESTIRARLGGWVTAIERAMNEGVPTIPPDAGGETQGLNWKAREPFEQFQEESSALISEIKGVFPELQKALPEHLWPKFRLLVNHKESIGQRRGAIAARDYLAKRPPTASYTPAEHLSLLRELDDARGRLRRIEERLASDMQTTTEKRLSERLTTASNRERWVLLAHFRKRLADRDRFGLSLTMGEVFDIHERIRGTRISCYTARGTPVKIVEVDGREVFAVLTPDTEGELVPTTAYTREMWQKNNDLAF